MTTSDVAALALNDITCRFAARDGGAPYTAVADATLIVREGEVVSVVGPTGCGKSTLLNVAAGLLAPSSGTVEVHGERLQAERGVNRRAGYMFQADALMPWRRGIDTVIAGLEFRG
ncbi:MAG: ATP-binding cassette domain-containing protein, partial [Alphaproteobacteria bacterium]|nr:ATP-binding cassette domain-containing protein [Alphaproteobacteria bacterium]